MIQAETSKGAENGGESTEFKVYTRRWFVMLVVFLLNFSNGTLWITYAPISTLVAQYYETTTDMVNLFSTSYFIMSVPLAFICTYMIKKVGLAAIIHIGGIFNTVGAIVRCIGVADFIGEPSTKLWVSFAGQICCAIAQSFVFYIPTKTSQLWFPEKERMLCTTVLSMADPVGAVLSQVITPYIVLVPEDIPTNNYVWMAIAVVSQVITFAVVHSSQPPTPPSGSSQLTENFEEQSWWEQIKAAFTNKNYLLLFVAIGFSIGSYATISTVTQQVLCGFGYSTQFAGLAASFPQLFGFLGAAAFNWYVLKTGKYIEAVKIVYAIGGLAAIGMFEFYLYPDGEAAILIFCAIFGFFGVGGFPLGLELGVEATYPVEETISSAFILMFGQFQAIVLIWLVGAISLPQRPEFYDRNVCSLDPDSPIEARDYTNSMIAMMVISTVINCALIFFFDTPYKRQLADKVNTDEANPEGAVNPATGEIITDRRKSALADYHRRLSTMSQKSK